MFEQRYINEVFDKLVDYAKEALQHSRRFVCLEESIALLYADEVSLSRTIKVMELQLSLVSGYLENPELDLRDLNSRYLRELMVLQEKFQADAGSRIKVRDGFYDKETCQVVAYTPAIKDQHIAAEQKCVAEEVSMHRDFQITRRTSGRTRSNLSRRLKQFEKVYADTLQQKEKSQMERVGYIDELGQALAEIKINCLEYISAFFSGDFVAVNKCFDNQPFQKDFNCLLLDGWRQFLLAKFLNQVQVLFVALHQGVASLHRNKTMDYPLFYDRFEGVCSQHAILVKSNLWSAKKLQKFTALIAEINGWLQEASPNLKTAQWLLNRIKEAYAEKRTCLTKLAISYWLDGECEPCPSIEQKDEKDEKSQVKAVSEISAGQVESKTELTPEDESEVQKSILHGRQKLTSQEQQYLDANYAKICVAVRTAHLDDLRVLLPLQLEAKENLLADFCPMTTFVRTMIATNLASLFEAVQDDLQNILKLIRYCKIIKLHRSQLEILKLVFSSPALSLEIAPLRGWYNGLLATEHAGDNLLRVQQSLFSRFRDDSMNAAINVSEEIKKIQREIEPLEALATSAIGSDRLNKLRKINRHLPETVNPERRGVLEEEWCEARCCILEPQDREIFEGLMRKILNLRLHLTITSLDDIKSAQFCDIFELHEIQLSYLDEGKIKNRYLTPLIRHVGKSLLRKAQCTLTGDAIMAFGANGDAKLFCEQIFKRMTLEICTVDLARQSAAIKDPPRRRAISVAVKCNDKGNGNTLMHIALDSYAKAENKVNFLGIIEYLLNLGCSPFAYNFLGETALRHAGLDIGGASWKYAPTDWQVIKLILSHTSRISSLEELAYKALLCYIDYISGKAASMPIEGLRIWRLFTRIFYFLYYGWDIKKCGCRDEVLRILFALHDGWLNLCDELLSDEIRAVMKLIEHERDSHLKTDLGAIDREIEQQEKLGILFQLPVSAAIVKTEKREFVGQMVEMKKKQEEDAKKREEDARTIREQSKKLEEKDRKIEIDVKVMGEKDKKIEELEKELDAHRRAEAFRQQQTQRFFKPESSVSSKIASSSSLARTSIDDFSQQDLAANSSISLQ